MGDIDPLVVAVFGLGKKCANDEYWGDDEHKAQADAALALLSAVLAAARAVIANRAGETGREATMTYRVLALVDAIAAADGAP